MIILVDFSKESCEIIEEEENPYSLSINIGFRDNGRLPVNFSDLSFGYKLLDDQNIVFGYQSKNYPIKYGNSDQEYLISEIINELIPDKKYTFEFWSEDGGVKIEKNQDIVLEKPPQPFPSWTFNSETLCWEAPIPKPEKGIHSWNEKTLSWDFLKEV